VKRLKLANARSRLFAYSGRAGKITHAYSARVKKGAVISEKPRIGFRQKRGAKVSLVVSRGKRQHRR
jgi:beta-lactam-binding protein with PASTA domain